MSEESQRLSNYLGGPAQNPLLFFAAAKVVEAGMRAGKFPHREGDHDRAKTLAALLKAEPFVDAYGKFTPEEKMVLRNLSKLWELVDKAGVGQASLVQAWAAAGLQGREAFWLPQIKWLGERGVVV